MSMQQYSERFLNQLIEMYDRSGLPAAVIDENFIIVWCSASACKIHPCLALPDGMLSLLTGCDFSAVKSTIVSRGIFSTAEPDNLFSGLGITICAIPSNEPGYYLVMCEPEQNVGDGRHPEGVARMLSSFGNQYRTSLSSIFSVISTLSQKYQTSGGEEGSTLQYLEVMNQQAFRLLRSCNLISEYSKQMYGLSPLQPRRVDVFYYLRELFDAASISVGQAGIPLMYSVPEGVFPMDCDVDKLSTVILNILANSCRFTRPGNVIDIKVRKNDKRITVSISDRGLGIPPDVQLRVYEPYYSYSRESTPFAGSGLGLTIAKVCVAALGGTITLTSKEGCGTTVSFTLPLEEDQTYSACPEVLFCDTADYVNDRFSPVHIAFSDSVKCPM